MLLSLLCTAGYVTGVTPGAASSGTPRRGAVRLSEPMPGALPERVAAVLCDYLEPSKLAEGPSVKLASPSELDAAFAQMAGKINLQLLYEHHCVGTTCSAADTTEVLVGEATRLFRLEGRKVTLSARMEWLPFPIRFLDRRRSQRITLERLSRSTE